MQYIATVFSHYQALARALVTELMDKVRWGLPYRLRDRRCLYSRKVLHLECCGNCIATLSILWNQYRKWDLVFSWKHLTTVNSLTALYCALLRIKKFNMNRFCFKTQFSSTRIVSNFANCSQIFVEKKKSGSFSQLPYGKAKNTLFSRWLLSVHCAAPCRQVVSTVAKRSSRTEG